MDHPVVDREEWLKARKALLLKEKEETHLRDSAPPWQALPWVRVEKDYHFDTPGGRKSLAGLFDGRSQLMVYHFMLAPGWKAGCPGCSFLSDHVDGALPHLNNHDVTWTAVSRAPLGEIQAYKARMGWKFPWASSFGEDFNYDYHVSFTQEQLALGSVDYNFRQTPSERANDELHGLSAFFQNKKGEVFHTYSSYARGAEDTMSTLMIFIARRWAEIETGTLSFVRRHDEYQNAAE